MLRRRSIGLQRGRFYMDARTAPRMARWGSCGKGLVYALLALFHQMVSGIFVGVRSRGAAPRCVLPVQIAATLARVARLS